MTETRFVVCSGPEHTPVDWRSSTQWQLAYRLCSPALRSAMEVHRPQYIRRAINISPDMSWAYVSNPKVGTSTIKWHLLSSLSDTPLDPEANLHRAPDLFLRLNQVSRFRPLERLEARGTKFVTLVRNPFARLVSAYESKIRAPGPASRFAAALGIQPDTGHASFETFVRAVCARSDRDMDPHWRPQRSQILYDVLEYDFLGHLERSNDMTELLNRCGVGFRPASERNRTTKAQSVADYYSDAMRELVISRYADDFELFGYSTDPTELDPGRSLSG